MANCTEAGEKTREYKGSPKKGGSKFIATGSRMVGFGGGGGGSGVTEWARSFTSAG